MTPYRSEENLQKMADYLKRNMIKGYSAEQLRWALVKQGQSRSKVDKAIELALKQQAEEAVKAKPYVEPKVEFVEPEPEKKGFFSRLFGFD